MRPHDNSCSSTVHGFNARQRRRFSIVRGRLRSTWIFAVVALLATLLAGCTAIRHSPPRTLDLGETYALLPIVNHTETPLAGRRVEDITAAVLHSRGLIALRRYPVALIDDASPLSSDDHLLEEAMEWAKSQGIRYAFTGAVDEWRYKVGIDGEPAVGVSVQLVDLEADQVMWSAVGGKSGWSREAVSAVAQTLIDDLFSELEFL